LDEAADRLRLAMEHVDDPRRRRALEERITALEVREAESEKDGWLVAAHQAQQDFESDPETMYRSLVGMLEEGVADHYLERPEDFRLAYVALNDGDAEAARTVFERHAAEDPEDPIPRLELGRCQLQAGNHAEARTYFESVWEAFGDEPIDLAGTLSLPSLWADALLGMEEYEPILERMAELARPEEDSPGLSYRFAVAQMNAGRLSDARDFLMRCALVFEGDQDFALLLARVTEELGDRAEAIQVLEQAIAPSCAVGRCGTPAMHTASLRTLARMHLDQGDNPQRAREVLALVARARRGQMEWTDELLLARYFQQVREQDAMREALDRARALAGPDNGPALESIAALAPA
jgi:tetratricopeptide (TPR) repeat protein